MDAYELLCDFKGTYLGLSVGDFESWLMEQCSRHEYRQLLAEYIVSQAIGEHHFNVIASNCEHRFSAISSGKTILCDFPASSISEAIHLDKWAFFVVSNQEVTDGTSVDDLLAADFIMADFYSLYSLLQD